MAKNKYDYPQSTHLVPRIEAVLRGVNQARQALKLVKEHSEPTPEARKLLDGIIKEALAALELASRALTGDDDQTQGATR